MSEAQNQKLSLLPASFTHTLTQLRKRWSESTVETSPDHAKDLIRAWFDFGFLLEDEASRIRVPPDVRLARDWFVEIQLLPEYQHWAGLMEKRWGTDWDDTHSRELELNNFTH